MLGACSISGNCNKCSANQWHSIQPLPFFHLCHSCLHHNINNWLTTPNFWGEQGKTRRKTTPLHPKTTTKNSSSHSQFIKFSTRGEHNMYYFLSKTTALIHSSFNFPHEQNIRCIISKLHIPKKVVPSMLFLRTTAHAARRCRN